MRWRSAAAILAIVATGCSGDEVSGQPVDGGGGGGGADAGSDQAAEDGGAMPDVSADTAVIKALKRMRMPQTQRNREFWLLLFAVVISGAALTLVQLGALGLIDPMILAIGGGLAVLDAIEASGYDTLHERPSIGKGKQARLLGRALVTHLVAKDAKPAAAQDAAADFLARLA